MKIDKDEIISTIKDKKVTIAKDTEWLLFVLVIIPFVIMTVALDGPSAAYKYFLDNFF